MLGAPPADARESARREILGPALGIMIVSGGAVLFYLIATGVVVIVPFTSRRPPDHEDWMTMEIAGAAYLFWALWAAFAFFGAWRMRALRSYRLSMTSAIISILPCTTLACCMFFLPFGIWAFIVLRKPEVKAEFR